VSTAVSRRKRKRRGREEMRGGMGAVRCDKLVSE
jgi:hypothetical protein